MSDTVQLYKVLKDGRSCHGGDLEWSLPTTAADGAVQPGQWHDIQGDLVLCKRGLHLTSRPGTWYVPGATLYRAEYEGEIVGDPVGDTNEGKVAVSRCRLVAEAEWSDHGVYLNGHHVVGGNATVRAYDSATVRAYDSATVEAYDSATVWAYDSATVRAYDSATVEAYDSATVRASGNATVWAYDSATVRASGNATVEAYDSATVRASGNATVEAHDNATVQSTWWHDLSAEVALADQAVHVDRRGGTVVCRVAGPAAEEAAP